jgi:(p)ppGpp synthase/HD superfamily hydrolase
MNSLIDRAIGFAARAHAGQWRKTGRVPYIAHPVGVAMILLEMGYDEEIIAAALLHDTVEDTDVTLDEIEEAFGPQVAEIVAAVSEPPKGAQLWERRKQHIIDTLRDAPLPAKIVAAADKYHNLSHTLQGSRAQGPGVWDAFGRGSAQQAWYYRSVMDSILANVPDPEQHPIFALLASVIDELFAEVTDHPPAEE